MSDSAKAHPAGDANRLALDLDELERQLRQLSSKPAQTAAPAEADPMAELARLVGRDDPIRSLLTGQGTRAAPSASAPLTPVAAPRPVEWAQPAPVADPYRRDAGAAAAPDDGPVFDDDAYDDRRSVASDDRPVLRGGYDAAPPASSTADFDDAFAPYPPGYHDPAAVEEESALPPRQERRSRRGVMTVGVLGLAAVIGGGTVFALRDSGPSAPSGAAPVITADPGPSRVAPQNPGGIEIPNQSKQIYERGGQPVPEATRVVNREEQPVDVRQTARALAQRDSIDGLIGASAPRPNASEQAQGGSLAALGEPKRVRTVAVRPDGTIITDASPAQPAPVAQSASVQPASVQSASAPPAGSTPARPAAAPRPPTMQLPDAAAPASRQVTASLPATTNPSAVAAARPVAAPATPQAASPAPAPAPAPAATAPAGSGPLSITPPASQQKLQQRVASTAPVAPVAAPAASAAAAPPAGGDFMVQLAARPSERDALEAFSQLQRRYTDLAGFSPVVRRAEVGDKTIYRLRVGSMSRDEATSLCSKLQASGGQCFVARN